MTQTTPQRLRADALLVARGLFPTRAQARAAIEAGGVTADGAAVTKPAQLLLEDAVLVAAPAHPWASRGGVKLAHALAAFGVDPEGRVCLDIGAAHGGFCDVLLARAALRVYAVDVGRGQLAPRLAGDPRLVNLEGVDARRLDAKLVPEPPTLITADASFIGLAKLLPAALALAAPQAELVALFKPQFEVGPDHVGKGGLVRNAAAIHAAQAMLTHWFVAQGWPVADVIASPILGGDGNAERLIWARRAR